ncbi:MAG TPA: SDR family oxidoreductase [Spirochaetia bacterium]|nr:SDR family oxidoreductase [Spirochaetia bacterium]
MKLSGKRAVVTGGGSGIGLATAIRLLGERCIVSLWDIDAAALRRAKASLDGIGGRVYTQVCDVSDSASVASAVRNAEQEMGGIDILINNAGHLAPGDFLDQPVGTWAKTIDVNVQGVLFTTHAVLSGMYERNQGHIVNVSSAAGTLGVAGLAVYAASKWAVWGLTESLRHEAWNRSKRGVRFSTVHPSYVAEGLFCIA